MSNYVKHPTADGDGMLSVAMPDGTTKQLPMKEGVVDWPDGVPMHNSYKPAPEPEALKQLKEQQKREEFLKMAAELGVTVDLPPVTNVSDVAQKESALESAQKALDADPENTELKKAVSNAKAALTKAKKAAGQE